MILLAAPAFLVKLVDPWSSLYSDSKLLPTLVTFAHIAPLLFAGGLAVSMDSATLHAVHGSQDERVHQLARISGAHRVVLWGLSLSFVSGVLLFAADLETFFDSWIWWTKATLIVLLLLNGFMMTRAEKAARGSSEDPALWRRLRFTAIVSMVLWFTIAFAGVALANVE
jgi:hypothetical protein